MRILVVDDNLSLRKSLPKLLSILGHNVSAVSSGHEAIEIGKEKYPPDLIFLDIMMPGLDGFDTLRKLRENGFSGRIYMYSALYDETTQYRCQKLGATGYAVKSNMNLQKFKDIING